MLHVKVFIITMAECIQELGSLVRTLGTDPFSGSDLYPLTTIISRDTVVSVSKWR